MKREQTVKTNGTTCSIMQGLAFALKRYEYKSYQEENSIWRFEIKLGMNGITVFSTDAKEEDLQKIINEIQKFIKILETDGGRNESA